MSVHINSINLNSICEGCLSVDRKLSVVSNVELQEFHQSIIQPLDNFHHPLALCWECIAVIKKIIKYKQQVQNARRHLLSFMLHQSGSLPPLSTLTTHVVQENPKLYYKYVAYKNKSQKATECSTKTMNPPENQLHDKDDTVLSHTAYYCEVSVNEGVIETKDESEKLREPVFIKVEVDSANSDDEFNGFYEENSENVDDTNPKAVVEAKPTECLPKRRSRKRKVEEMKEFNESDEEPLKKKKMKKKKLTEDAEKKPIGPIRRRGKGKNKGAKKPRVRRELPAGVIDNACAARSLRRLGLPAGRMQPVALTWQQVEEERQKMLVSDAYLRHAHRCASCALGFNHSAKLANHMRKHDPAAGELECAVCRVRCQSQHALASHRRRHRIRWRCCLCGELGSRAAVVADHVARTHGGGVPTHVCGVCGDTSTTLSKLRNHMKSHAERQRCDLCSKTFRDKSTLKTHLFIHKGEKEYSCPSCGKMFLFKKAMQLHAATHAAPALLYCHQCDMNFKNQMSFYQHMKYNLKHVDPARLKYECSLCPKRFMKASRLREHHTAVHLRQAPVRCAEPGCGFACASRAVLRAHLRSAHRRQPAARNHVCHACGKAYTNKKTLEGHLRSHSGERPFACVRCGATFGYEAALYNHTRLVHLKDKPSRKPQACSEWPAVPVPTEATTEEQVIPICPAALPSSSEQM